MARAYTGDAAAGRRDRAVQHCKLVHPGAWLGYARHHGGPGRIVWIRPPFVDTPNRADPAMIPT